MKKKPVSSVSITGGTERLLGGRSWVFGCTATYGDGSTVTVRPTWTVEPTTYAQIDADGRLTTSALTADQTLTVTATYTDGTTVSQTFTVKLTAPTAVAAEVKNVSAAVRWPFSNLLDVDYEVAVQPAGSKVNVSLSGYDADRRQTLAAKTLTGDGANGPPHLERRGGPSGPPLLRAQRRDGGHPRCRAGNRPLRRERRNVRRDDEGVCAGRGVRGTSGCGDGGTQI